MRLLIPLLLAAAPLVAQGPARSFAGHWTGAIQLPGRELAFDVDLADSAGGYRGDLSIPVQNLRDVPLARLVARGDSLFFALPGIPGDPTFAGARTADGQSVRGTFTQGGQSLPFAMQRGAAPDVAARSALEGFDKWVDSALAAWRVVGAGVGIVVNGEVVYARGHGLRDRDKNLPVTTQTLFAIGSSSKAFTVFAIGALVDQGKVEWDKPVADYLPGFRMYDPDVTRRLSVRDLVTHRSGLPRHDLVWYNNNALTREETVRRLRYLEPNKDLRETFQYNNLMYLTAGYLVGRLNGSTWEDAVRALVFQPLGMTRSNFSVAESQRAADFSFPYEVRRDTIHQRPFRDISMIGPAGSINSSIDDMLKWVGLHLAGGKIGGRQVMQSATLRDMHAPHMAIAAAPTEPELGAASYAMGWFVRSYRGHYEVEHGGNIDGFSALVTLYPQDNIGIVVLTNQNGSALPRLVTRHAGDRLFGGPRRDWNKEALARRDAAQAGAREAERKKETVRVSGTQPSRRLDAYAGDYVHHGYGTLAVTLDSGHLTATYNGIRTALSHWHYDVFSGLRNAADPTFEDMKYNFAANLRGDVDAVAAPFELLVDPIVFQRQPDARLRDSTYVARFVGRYQLPTDTVTVTRVGAVLTATVGRQAPIELIPYRRSEFDLKGLTGFSVVFALDAQGRVTEAALRQPNGVFTAKRLP